MRSDNVQKTSTKWWHVLLLAMTIAGTGCVFNPYVKTYPVQPMVGRGDDGASVVAFERIECTPSSEQAGDAISRAIRYATCTRRDMSRKAGGYAWMNNGGSALLLATAGFAGYRGVRGGHDAQVSGLTAGGAVIYGSQQYLYRKPRELTYLQGVGALDCAIGATLLKSTEKQNDIALMRTEAESLPSASYLWSLQSKANRVENPSPGCTQEAKDEYRTLVAIAETLAGPDRDALIARRQSLVLRADRLLVAKEQAGILLISTTDGIRNAVNRQLAMQQPDPAELKKLIADLKLPAFAGMSEIDKKSDLSPMPNQTKAISRWAKVTQRTRNKRSVVIHRQLPCNLVRVLPQLRLDVASLKNQRKAEEDALDRIEVKIARAETSMGMSGNSDPIKACSLGRTDTLLPFGLALASEGAQAVKPGSTLKVAITGGLPPYGVRLMSDDASGLSATAQMGEGGAFEIVVAVPEKAPDGKVVSWLIRDAVGASEVLKIKVQK